MVKMGTRNLLLLYDRLLLSAVKSNSQEASCEISSLSR